MNNCLTKKIELLFISKFLTPNKREQWAKVFTQHEHPFLNENIQNIVFDICSNPAKYFYRFEEDSEQQHIKNFICCCKKILNQSLYWIFPSHPHYPSQLKINHKHQSFFAIGNTSVLTKKIFTVIGSRKTSSTSQKIASLLGFYINETNHTIASGGAIGIDIASQLHTFKNSVQKNILVALPSGVCNIVPKCHERIIRNISLSGGCIISTPHPFASAPRYSYILRNQFLAHISEAVYVVQANNKSGALSTAEYAIDHGIDVTVWNGELNDIRSKGSRKLIADGVQHFSNAKDFPFIV